MTLEQFLQNISNRTTELENQVSSLHYKFNSLAKTFSDIVKGKETNGQAFEEVDDADDEPESGGLG